MEAVTETMLNGKIKKLLVEQPMLSILLTVFGVELTETLFEEEKEQEGEE